MSMEQIDALMPPKNTGTRLHRRDKEGVRQRKPPGSTFLIARYLKKDPQMPVLREARLLRIFFYDTARVMNISSLRWTRAGRTTPVRRLKQRTNAFVISSQYC